MEKQSMDRLAAAREMEQQIADILDQDRAGAQTDGGICPPQVEEEWKPAVTKAMNLLLHRPRTEKELRERLLRCGYLPEAVQCAVRYVSFFGYLNDRKYAESYVLGSGNRKSRSALRAELTGRGVDEGAIEAALELLETDERSIAEELLKKRYGSPHQMEEKELRRAVGFLGRKGFSSGLVWSVIRDYQKSAMFN